MDRIREIRASERRFYQKITDIYIQCSYDYDADAELTHKFFAHAQNKLEYAVTGMTAAEIVKLRANHNLPNMGLTTWKNQKRGGKITVADTYVAKNYLTEKEIKDLNKLVTMFLDYAQNLAEKGKRMYMADWHEKLDDFLKFNEYQILKIRKN
ncbi:MAG: virulence RhuM family protein [Sphingomonadales bacterium]|nr:virulence RhuM family protein [Sphingomonadales bacterium]